MKRILLGGLLGAIVMLVWLVVADGILGFKRGIDMKQLPQERAIYAFLLDHVKEPGCYVCNPAVQPNQRYPGHDPIFAIHYTGLGHDDADQEMLGGFVTLLLALIAGTWVLANASSRILSRYGSRVGFFVVIGLALSLAGFAGRFGISAYSLGDALALAVHDLAGWSIAGLVVAWILKPSVERGTANVG